MKKLLPGFLSEYAIQYSVGRLKYTSKKCAQKNSKLIFSVRNNYTKRTTILAAIYITSVLEYLASELLELSVYRSIDRKSKTIRNIDIMKVFRYDYELGGLYERDSIMGLCPHGKIYNPVTGHFVKKEGRIGKQILNKKRTSKIKKKQKYCPVGKVINPKTGRSVKRTGKIGKEIVISNLRKSPRKKK